MNASIERVRIRSICTVGVACAAVVALGWSQMVDWAPAPGPRTPAELCCDPRIPVNETNTPSGGGGMFRIGAAGSYYLPEPLSGQPGMHGIVIAADDVSLDLMGFALEGQGSGHGIQVEPNLRNISIRNGVVRNWAHGILVMTGTNNCLVEFFQASDNKGGFTNGGAGIYAAHLTYAVTVRYCSAYDNDSVGIAVNAHSTVHDSVAVGNGNSGIAVGTESLVARCTAARNSDHGIYADGRSTVTDCVATENLSAGVCSGTNNDQSAPDGSTISNCTSTHNGIGIRVVDRSYVFNNTCVGNTTYGIHTEGVWNRIDSNHLAQNVIGLLLTGTSNVVLRNSALSNTQCNYSLGSGNDVGPIGTAGGSTSPFANIALDGVVCGG